LKSDQKGDEIEVSWLAIPVGRLIIGTIAIVVTLSVDSSQRGGANESTILIANVSLAAVPHLG
jgi:hypothetical protein